MAESKPSVWQWFLTNEGYSYYYNTETQEVSWTPPPGYVHKECMSNMQELTTDAQAEEQDTTPLSQAPVQAQHNHAQPTAEDEQVAGEALRKMNSMNGLNKQTSQPHLLRNLLPDDQDEVEDVDIKELEARLARMQRENKTMRERMQAEMGEMNSEQRMKHHVLQKQVLKNKGDLSDMDKVITGTKKWRRKTKRKPAEDEGDNDLMHRIATAVRYCRDAKSGQRTIRLSGKKQTLHAIHKDPWFERLLFTSVLLYMGLVFLERPNQYSEEAVAGKDTADYVNLIGLVCVSVMAADVGLKLAYLGPVFFRKWWNSVLLLLVIFFLVDTISFAMGSTVQPSRALRALYLVGRWRRLRSAVRSVRRTLPNLLPLGLISLFFLAFYSICGVHIMHGWYPTKKTRDGAYGDNFDHVGSAALTLFITLSGENYPEVMAPAFNRHGAFSLFFISYTTIGIFILLVIVVAVLYTSYTDMRKESIMYDMWKERTSLAYAFSELEEDGSVDWRTWHLFLKKLIPKLDEVEARKLFNKVAASERKAELEAAGLSVADAPDTDDDRKVGIISFFEMLDVLLLRFSFTEQKENRFGEARIPSLQPFVSGRPFRRFIGVVLIVNLVTLALVYEGMSDDLFTAVVVLDAIFMAIFVVEMTLRLLAWGGSFFDLTVNRIDLALVCIATTGTVLQLVLSPDRNSLDWRVLSVVSNIRLIRCILVYEVLQKPFLTVLRILPTMMSMGVLMLCIMYMYAVVGMELFYRGYSDVENDVKPHFETFPLAMMTVFQLILAEGWGYLMYEGMGLTSSAAAIAYYASLHVVLCIFFLNLLMAGIVEMFVLVIEMDNEDMSQFRLNINENDEGNDEELEYDDNVVVLKRRRRLSRELIASTDLVMSDQDFIQMGDKGPGTFDGRKQGDGSAAPRTGGLAPVQVSTKAKYKPAPPTTPPPKQAVPTGPVAMSPAAIAALADMLDEGAVGGDAAAGGGGAATGGEGVKRVSSRNTMSPADIHALAHVLADNGSSNQTSSGRLSSNPGYQGPSDHGSSNGSISPRPLLRANTMADSHRQRPPTASQCGQCGQMIIDYDKHKSVCAKRKQNQQYRQSMQVGQRPPPVPLQPPPAPTSTATRPPPTPPTHTAPAAAPPVPGHTPAPAPMLAPTSTTSAAATRQHSQSAYGGFGPPPDAPVFAEVRDDGDGPPAHLFFGIKEINSMSDEGESM